MKTEISREPRRIFILLIFIALLLAMSGCGGSTNQSNANQTVNRGTPQNSSAQESPTPSNPTAGLAGAWETTYDISNIIPGYPSSTAGTGNQFAQWRFSEGIKKGDEYGGKVTNELNNENIADYSIAGKTITLTFLPVSSGTTTTSGTSRNYEYEISDNGNTLTLKGRDPIVLRKGTGNSDMENVSYVISNKVDWMIRPALTMNSSSPDADYVTFETARKSDQGYGGRMTFYTDNPSYPPPGDIVEIGQYLLTSKDKVTLTFLGGPKSGTYKLIDNKVLQIDFTDPNEKDMVLTAR